MNDIYAQNLPPEALGDPSAQAADPTVQLPVCQKILTADLSGDFSLPDYQPEIKRLLRISVSTLPPERYFAGDSMDLEGSLDYFALYMGNDNQLYCAPLSTEYHMTLPLSEERDRDRDRGRTAYGLSPLDGDLTCSCDISVDPVSGRVTAPRRLNIKSRVKADVKMYGTCALSPDTSKELSPASIERLTAKAETARLYRAVGTPLDLQDDMILSPSDGGDVRVICAEGQVMVGEALAGQGTVTCRGDVLLKLTLCPSEVGDGEEVLPTVTTRRIPFSQLIEVPGVTPECACCAHGACSELSVELEEGHLHTELSVIMEVLSQRNESSTYTKDLYSTRKETSCTYTEYPTRHAMGCFNGNFTLSDSLPLTELNIHPATRVVDVTAVAYPEDLSADPEKRRCILTGRCHVHAILFREGEYATTEMDFPFRYEKDGCLPEGFDDKWLLTYDGNIKVMTCRARMDGERIGVDAEIGVALRVSVNDTLTSLSSVTYGEDVTRNRGEYVICYPSSEDTLWSVAKRYHAPMTVLSAANSISVPESADAEGCLAGVDYLIV
ncbi:MAG: hypothetical protein E7661_08285 [Ruminococcaceae bacterium]|nr:hypothetical protein [Oscillospiraceae bacterium]